MLSERDEHVQASWNGWAGVELPPGLDPGIEGAVLVLLGGGVETFESCQGGEGHAFPEPTVRFFGDATEGCRAYAWAVQHELPVLDLRRVWHHQGGELVGPDWALTFRRQVPRNA